MNEHLKAEERKRKMVLKPNEKQEKLLHKEGLTPVSCADIKKNDHIRNVVISGFDCEGNVTFFWDVAAWVVKVETTPIGRQIELRITHIFGGDWLPCLFPDGDVSEGYIIMKERDGNYELHIPKNSTMFNCFYLDYTYKNYAFELHAQ